MSALKLPKIILGISVKGNVYTLSAGETEWVPLVDSQRNIQGFKRACLSEYSIWALGCDYQLYLWVPKTDIPIRVQETSYENERWIPARGWHKQNLLPVDPFAWSTSDGQVSTPRDDFKLPSGSWKWENEWYVDETVDGFITDRGGWRYSALDFGQGFTHVKRFNSCVRRRKWIRYRLFAKVDEWRRVPSFQLDPSSDLLADLAVGAYDVPHQEVGFSLLWVVTINGEVLCRQGITRQCPEGKNWTHVQTDGHEVLAVSSHASGATWLVTWQGCILVRTGVTWQEPMGTAWLQLEGPEDSERIVQVAVGINGAWALGHSGDVYFRKGVRSDCIEGTGWLRLSHCLKMASVTRNDKVCGVQFESHLLNIRTGVTPDEPSGRKWQHLDLPHVELEAWNHLKPGDEVHSITEISDSVSNNSTDLSNDTPTAQESADRTDDECVNDVTTAKHSNEVKQSASLCFHNPSYEESRFPRCGSADCISPADTINSMNGKSTSIDSLSSSLSSRTETTEEDIGDAPHTIHTETAEFPKPSAKAFFASKSSVVRHSIKNKLSNTATYKLVQHGLEVGKETFEKNKHKLDKVKHHVQKASATVLKIPTPAVPRMRFESDVETVSIGSMDDEEMARDFDQLEINGRQHQTDYVRLVSAEPESGPLRWVWVTAGPGILSEQQLLLWAKQSVDSYSTLASLNTRWRDGLLESLRQRNAQLTMFNHYETAIEQTCWSKKAQLRFWCEELRPLAWVECDLELTQDDTDDRASCFSYTYEVKGMTKGVVRMAADLCCVYRSTSNCNAAAQMFRVITADRMEEGGKKSGPLCFKAKSEQEAEAWVGTLNAACAQSVSIRGTVAPNAVWACTTRGDVFARQKIADSDQWHWRLLGGHMQKVASCAAGVTWALGYDGQAWVYSGGFGGDLYKDMPSADLHPQTDSQTVYTYENQRWTPISGYSDKGLYTLLDRYAWSDETGTQERTKDAILPENHHWTWCDDWSIDRTVPNGVDEEGWQYARHFGRPFTGKKRLRSYVRRRRWKRRSQLNTNAPWRSVGDGNLHFADLAAATVTSDEYATVGIWAVSMRGDLLGTTWEHIATDQPFISVSACPGPAHLTMNVWCLATDGSVWRRLGVTEFCLQGTGWCHVSPPKLKGVKFHSIEVGMTEVYALDSKDELWKRKGITARQPDGLKWAVVARKVRHVSLSPCDKVWAVVDLGNIWSSTSAEGTIVTLNENCHKTVIGSGWSSVCAKAETACEHCCTAKNSRPV